jgi:hypothetical protein
VVRNFCGDAIIVKIVTHMSLTHHQMKVQVQEAKEFALFKHFDNILKIKIINFNALVFQVFKSTL